MTVQERLDDIQRISGLSEEIIRRVLDAERESIVNSLKQGERALLIGRCTMTPRIQVRFKNGEAKREIGVSFKISNSIQNELCSCEKYLENQQEKENTSLPDNLRVEQIESLL